MMQMLSDVYYQTMRDLRGRFRMPVWIFLSLFQPIIWLLLFTQIFQSLSQLPQLGTVSYLQFFAPGVVVMTVIFGSAWAGMGMLQDMDMGILSKMLATPVTRPSIIIGRVISAMVMLVIQAILIFIIAVIMGVRLATGVPGVLLSIVIISLLGLGLAALSNGLALLLRRQEPLIAAINFIALPSVFLSSAMMPAQLLPEWLNTLRHFNPVDYAVVGVRGLVLQGYVWSDLGTSLLVLLAWSAAGITFGALMFRSKAE